ncbi:MAG: FmdB family zinc ribbon protein [Petrotogales bacterium]
MPLYNYYCKQCKRKHQLLLKMSENGIQKCPDCGQPMERMISSVGVLFKSDGFYITDSKKSSSKTKGNSSKKKAESKE